MGHPDYRANFHRRMADILSTRFGGNASAFADAVGTQEINIRRWCKIGKVKPAVPGLSEAAMIAVATNTPLNRLVGLHRAKAKNSKPVWPVPI